VDAFEPYRPSERAYSPLSFFFNFSHNVIKGAVADALLRGHPWRLSLDDLLTARSLDAEQNEAKIALANTLMWYARNNPARMRGKLVPVSVYAPAAGRRAFGAMMRTFRG